jgi:hypothetical protein
MTGNHRIIEKISPAAAVLIIASMSSGESAETWLEKGAEAYAKDVHG